MLKVSRYKDVVYLEQIQINLSLNGLKKLFKLSGV